MIRLFVYIVYFSQTCFLKTLANKVYNCVDYLNFEIPVRQNRNTRMYHVYLSNISLDMITRRK